MVDVKTRPVNQYPGTSPVRGFVGQAAEVTGNVIELAELQIQLAKEDASDAIKIAVQPMLMIVIGGILLLASLPVLLLATAGFIARYSGMSIEVSQLIVGLTAVILSLGALYASFRYLKSTLTPFTRSAQELKQNITWLKTIFRSSNS